MLHRRESLASENRCASLSHLSIFGEWILAEPSRSRLFSPCSLIVCMWVASMRGRREEEAERARERERESEREQITRESERARRMTARETGGVSTRARPTDRRQAVRRASHCRLVAIVICREQQQMSLQIVIKMHTMYVAEGKCISACPFVRL